MTKQVAMLHLLGVAARELVRSGLSETEVRAAVARDGDAHQVRRRVMKRREAVDT
jgi:hypothetical protein